MTARRLLSLLALFALLAMPFGHGMASAQGPVSAGHCHGAPPAPGKAHPAGIDCAIACAALAPRAPSPSAPLAPAAAAPTQAPVPALPGIHLAAEPPPPRHA